MAYNRRHSVRTVAPHPPPSPPSISSSPPLVLSSLKSPPAYIGITTENWNKHRETIWRFYIAENRTIQEVSRILKQEYDFRPTYVIGLLNPSTLLV